MTIQRLVLLGAGDVTTRFVIPAVAELVDAGVLDGEALTLTVVGRHEASTDEVRDEARAAIDERVDVASGARDAVVAAIGYHRGDAASADDLRPVLAGDDPVAVHLALPASVFGPAIAALGEVGLPEGSRLVVEKPFGTDRDDAAALNAALRDLLPEEGVVRVDHFLGMRSTHHLLALRFANRLFEPVWCAEHVERVDVVWDETLALEGRAGFYDSTGAARDMLQNHLLQVTALVAMEPPASIEWEAIADRKVEVLRAMRPWDGDPVSAGRRARYTAGEVDGEAVPAYVDEDGVEADRGTETYAEMTFEIDVPRWRGVPFRLRSGKALAEDRSEVTLRLRPCGQQGWGDGRADVIRLGVDPDRLELDLEVAAPDVAGETVTQRLTHAIGEAALSAYAVLYRGVVTGGTGLSVRDDEAEAAWAVVEPILAAWERGDVPLEEYPAGSSGPSGSAERG